MKQKVNDYDKISRLYELYEQKMYVVAYSILNNRFQAEDAVQEAFIKIMKNRDKIKETESDKTKAFIIRIIKHTAIDVYRMNKREMSTFTVIETETQNEIEDQVSPIEEMLRQMEDKEKVNMMLAFLPDIYREVLEYRCIHQLSVKETAAVLGISEVAVRKRYERARTSLMKRMGDEQYEYKII